LLQKAQMSRISILTPVAAKKLHRYTKLCSTQPCVCHNNHCDKQPGVPRSTQPYTIRGMVKWVLMKTRVKSGEAPLHLC